MQIQKMNFFQGPKKGIYVLVMPIHKTKKWTLSKKIIIFFLFLLRGSFFGLLNYEFTRPFVQCFIEHAIELQLQIQLILTKLLPRSTCSNVWQMAQSTLITQQNHLEFAPYKENISIPLHICLLERYNISFMFII